MAFLVLAHLGWFLSRPTEYSETEAPITVRKFNGFCAPSREEVGSHRRQRRPISIRRNDALREQLF